MKKTNIIILSVLCSLILFWCGYQIGETVMLKRCVEAIDKHFESKSTFEMKSGSMGFDLDNTDSITITNFFIHESKNIDSIDVHIEWVQSDR